MTAKYDHWNEKQFPARLECAGQFNYPEKSHMADIIDKQLSNSAYKQIIQAPIKKVNIAEWLFTLPEAEYCRCCPPDRISCGSTSTDDGEQMSINVEMIGRTLMIQHYVAEIATPSHRRMVSLSDASPRTGVPACR